MSEQEIRVGQVSAGQQWRRKGDGFRVTVLEVDVFGGECDIWFKGVHDEYDRMELAGDFLRTFEPIEADRGRPVSRLEIDRPVDTTRSLDWVLENYRDGDEHGWYTEFQFLLLDETHGPKVGALIWDVRANGIREPIHLGNDGRVWDGHHRLCAAHVLGLTEVPVRIEPPADRPICPECFTVRAVNGECGCVG